MRAKKEIPAAPPPRKELSDNPVKFCNEIARLFRARKREADTQEGVMTQPGAHLILSMLAISDGINQLELVNQTHLRPPTVSVILRRMEGEGLVERRSDLEDKRAVRVYLTEAGRTLDRENIEMIRKLDAEAMEGLSEEEIAIMMKLLIKIRNNLLPQGEKNDNAHREGEEKKQA